MKNRAIYICPIWTHYRSSVIDELIKLNSNSIFIGASTYLSNIPIVNKDKVFNKLNKTSFNIFGHTFYWFHGLLNQIKIIKTDKIIISGFDPHMLHLIFFVFYLKYIKKVDFYWWSHANYGSQGRVGIFFRMIFYKLAKGVFTYSKKGRDLLIEYGLNKKNISVINNSINYEDYGWINNSLNKGLTKKKCFNIIYSGKLSYEKKIEILIKAIGILIKKDIKVNCTIVGDGTESKVLKKLTHDENLDSSIKFVGSNFGKYIYKYFLKADILVIPGAVGLSIVHAFSYGLPIITSDNMKIHGPEIELLTVGDNGDLFESENANSLACKIIKWKNLLSNNSNLKYSKNCINNIYDKGYLPNIVASKIYNGLYK